MTIQFYNVKTRKKVAVDESQVKKCIFRPKGGTPRYGVRATHQGTNMVRFVSKKMYDSLNCPRV